ncbi:hypothetical protein [Gloeocapsa sp. PCC 7428]|uniref:hypothetical protein n=1 Tax=Gloeocapsa sp. PCC 7428 TaxID=1173026 RepID=UPI0012DD3D23|nr:hypothetical protein [Gloeocapsa sp. PCC 7428]
MLQDIGFRRASLGQWGESRQAQSLITLPSNRSKPQLQKTQPPLNRASRVENGIPPEPTASPRRQSGGLCRGA